jgi:glutamine amidotransferase
MKTLKVGIIDYGAGNIGSVLNLVRKVGGTPHLVKEPEQLITVEKLILPGVGSFDNGMTMLNASGMIPALQNKVLIENIPILGICLGAQLFTRRSEEGVLPGLGWIKADTVKFCFSDSSLKIPHMGWNYINIVHDHPIFSGMYPDPKFYFVHKYYMKPDNEDSILTSTVYGSRFTSGIYQNNIIGFQFHPEKSHKYGMKIIENFLRI